MSAEITKTTYCKLNGTEGLLSAHELLDYGVAASSEMLERTRKCPRWKRAEPQTPNTPLYCTGCIARGVYEIDEGLIQEDCL